MNRSFTWLALSISLTLTVVLLVFNDVERGRELPLLTILFISEVGAFISLFGFINGLQKTRTNGAKPLLISGMALCLILAAAFFWNGYQHWPKL
jgi:heme/copper-type cytochrome/quinol oxidase subunit 4